MVTDVRLSIFGNGRPVTDVEAAETILPLTFCFPQMPATFWGYVAKEAISRGVSKKRLEYIVKTLISNHRYPTMTIADVFDIDITMHELTQDEIERLTIPHRPLAQIFFCGKYHIVYKDEADKYGYKSVRYYSNAEMSERELAAVELRHRKEFKAMKEEWRKKHGDEPMPEVQDFDNIIERLAKQFRPKY